MFKMFHDLIKRLVTSVGVALPLSLDGSAHAWLSPFVSNNRTRRITYATLHKWNKWFTLAVMKNVIYTQRKKSALGNLVFGALKVYTHIRYHKFMLKINSSLLTIDKSHYIL